MNFLLWDEQNVSHSTFSLLDVKLRHQLFFIFYLKQGAKGEKGSPGPKVGQMMLTMSVAPSFPAL